MAFLCDQILCNALLPRQNSQEYVRQAPTCFQQNDLVVLAQVHEAGDAFGELHHVLDGVGDVVRALLPHPLGRLGKRHGKGAG